jgi:hypothetical protein
VLWPSDETDPPWAVPLGEVATDLRAARALLLDPEDLQLPREPGDREVVEVRRDVAEDSTTSSG